MKKVILVIAMVFATGSFVNANTSENIEVQVEDCAQDAWDFGTREGGGNERDEYLWTNIYYTLIC
ncbi:hypothetical protein [Tenacibaculum finnmarkense]|uniref:hypothetical protein n=1 Tax=Tenacibaculum finnmarkense TaxID=2781243 RepID=UPI001EFB2858|nr:hypothetical protein [Tenacibaculum finnmarkense]